MAYPYMFNIEKLLTLKISLPKSDSFIKII